MDNDSGALILLIVLIVSGFLLILIRLSKLGNDFGRKKQYFLNEMHRAADYNDRYWRRELRCLYLCLIPFVTERNVMKVYPVFFHRAKHAEKEKHSDGLMHILAPQCLLSASVLSAFAAQAGLGLPQAPQREQRSN